MHLLKSLLFIVFVFCSHLVFGQDLNIYSSQQFYYNNAFTNIDVLIDSQSASSRNFKQAVYEVENAFYDNDLPKTLFDKDIENLLKLIEIVRENDSLKYNAEDKENIETFAAIFKVMTDSNYFNIDNKLYLHVPFLYDFDDVFGQEDWSQMFVTKLLATNKGNCHSLPYLYKILAEELGETAHLALAPNHIYIKHYSKKTGWYNTELTSASFPIDAWLTASGYIHLDAIRNGVYMDTLNQKESLALTLVDLANGYERKFGVQDGEFILKAADRALEVNPNFINALLLKAETQKQLFEDKMLLKGIDDPNVLMEQDEEAKDLFLDMQSLYVRIHQLGYRQMPEEMYLDWLATLQEEREKYENKSIPVRE